MHAIHMLTDHKKMGKELKDYVILKNLTIEDVNATDADNSMPDEKRGEDWDRGWADKMVADHEKMVAMFEDASGEVKDPALKQLIINAIPAVKAHLDMSKQLQEQLSK